MKIDFAGYEFIIRPEVYPPAEDSYLLARNLKPEKGARVLDMGTGCGIQGIVAAERAKTVLACDINPRAVECARENCRINGVTNMDVVLSDLFERVRGSFDLITFNPPYLHSNPEDPADLLSKAWDGGQEGRDITDRFIHGLKDHLEPRGRVLLVQSYLNGLEETVSMLEGLGIGTRIIAEERFFFERLYLLEASFQEAVDGKETSADLSHTQETPLHKEGVHEGDTRTQDQHL